MRVRLSKVLHDRNRSVVGSASTAALQCGTTLLNIGALDVNLCVWVWVNDRRDMIAFIRRLSFHYEIYRSYPLSRLPALKNAWRIARA
jgi:hypothetical protein